jgi:glutamine cyclotransferase
MNPAYFTVISIINVTDEGKPLNYINELELVGDFIYANILPSTIIAKIDKISGLVIKKWDFSSLKQKQLDKVHSASKLTSLFWDNGNNIFNGIAYRASTNTFLVTGKKWDFIFEVALQ